MGLVLNPFGKLTAGWHTELPKLMTGGLNALVPATFAGAGGGCERTYCDNGISVSCRVESGVRTVVDTYEGEAAAGNGAGGGVLKRVNGWYRLENGVLTGENDWVAVVGG